MPWTHRPVFVIGPDKKLKLSLLYPAATGCNFDELPRVVDSLQLTTTKKMATQMDWKQVSPTTNVSKKDKEREKKRPPPNSSCGFAWRQRLRGPRGKLVMPQQSTAVP